MNDDPVVRLSIVVDLLRPNSVKVLPRTCSIDLTCCQTAPGGAKLVLLSWCQFVVVVVQVLSGGDDGGGGDAGEGE